MQQINIDLEQLIAFLNKVYCWIPPNNSYIRGEIQNFIDQLKQHRQR
jgi:hypothetical protein